MTKNSKRSKPTTKHERPRNTQIIIRRITEALEAAKATAGTNPPVEPAAPGEKLTKLDVPALQARYLDVVGRPTQSTNAAYLVWKIREAQKGRITIGPRRNARREGVTFKVLPLRLEADLVAELDEAWRRQGLPSRMELIRRALQSFAATTGETALAALFDSQTAGAQP